MRRCQANLPNRCRRQIDRIAHRVFDGEQWMDREGCAATTGNTYCGNLLWQSGLTLLAYGVRVSGNVGPAIGNTLGFYVPLCPLGPTKNWGFKRTYVNGVEK